MKEKGSIKLWTRLVMNGRKKIDEVPAVIRAEVEKMVKKRRGAHGNA